MEGKKISVIVPVYNILDYLEKCVDSLRGQTYENLQMILVDDGSTDGSGALCDELAAKDSRILVIHKENGGVSSARNAGVEAAEGDYISFVDSDDYLEPKMYEVLLGAAEEQQLDVTACGYFFTDKPQDLALENLGKISILHKVNAMERCISDDLHSAMCGAVWNKIYRTETLKQYLVFDPKYIMAEDMLVTLRCLKHAKRVGQVNECFYHYVLRENSVVNSYKKNKASSIGAHHEMYEELKDEYPQLAKQVMIRSMEQNYNLLITALKAETYFEEDITALCRDLKENRKYVKESEKISLVGRMMIRVVTLGGWAPRTMRRVLKKK